VTGATLLLRM